MQNAMSAHQEVPIDMPALVGDSDGEDMPELEFSDSDEEGFLAPGQEAWRVTTLDARTVPRTVSTQTQYPRWVLPIMADSESDHEDMPPLLTDSDDNEELPALLLEWRNIFLKFLYVIHSEK